MIHIPAQDFSLADTLACGQAFRWHARNGAHYGFIHHCAVRVRHIGSTLTVETVDSSLTAADVIRYFALDLDLAPILASIDADAQIHDAIARHRGLRILRQDPWECLA
ncbi:MAG: 8-oxoguanine DNA glycosylase, N-terminal domain-containing protein, partial [Candidatus Omnitrophica bacterium]|nr:8-oxoguanine DNA glycosylase, N-terminal domain-containing protein [Candidatus Omnitrophota bacterium]